MKVTLRFFVLFIVFSLSIIVCENTFAGFTTVDGYSYVELYNTAGTGTVIGGLDLETGKLYFGNWNQIKSLDLANNNIDTVGSIDETVDISVVKRYLGRTYTAFATSFSSPYPYQLGYINDGGVYTYELTEDGIYDVAVSPSGELYIVANPDALGSRLFRYDYGSGSLIEVANIGGYSGGIAFDSQGNLYYSDQGIYEQREASVLKFTAGQLVTGGLNADDAVSVLDIVAGYLAVDESGLLYATTGYGTNLAKYDMTSGTKICDIAYTDGSEYIGKFVFTDSGLYTFTTDFASYYSTIWQIVPEPATVVLFGLAGLWLRLRRVVIS